MLSRHRGNIYSHENSLKESLFPPPPGGVDTCHAGPRRGSRGVRIGTRTGTGDFDGDGDADHHGNLDHHHDAHPQPHHAGEHPDLHHGGGARTRAAAGGAVADPAVYRWHKQRMGHDGPIWHAESLRAGRGFADHWSFQLLPAQ